MSDRNQMTEELLEAAPVPEEYIPDPFFVIADKLCELYISYRQRYVMMVDGSIFIPKTKETGPCPLTNKAVFNHLNQKYAIGVFAGDYASKFVCFDVDDGSQETVRKIIELSETFGIPKDYIYVSSSGGKGYHVEVFFDELVYTEKLAMYYDWVILKGNLNPQKVEFRPTRTQAIKLPLSRHAKTGNICWFVDRETFEPIRCKSYILTIKRFSAEKFKELVSRCGMPCSISHTSSYELEKMENPDRPRTRELTKQEQDVISGTCPYPYITEPGTRHCLTRTIAMHNRISGMTEEESLQSLLAWWADQDKTITLTPDREAIEDIENLVAWTFSESFNPPGRKLKLTITKDLIARTLFQKNKSERKIIFLIGCFQSVYGYMNMSYERIGKYAGISMMSAKRSIASLLEKEQLTMKNGKTGFANGRYARKANTYTLPQEEATHDGIEFIMEMPLVYTSAEILNKDDPDGHPRWRIPELEPEGFTEFYYETMLRTVSKRTMRKYLTAVEIAAVDCSEIA